jgi:hypothetical protein
MKGIRLAAAAVMTTCALLLLGGAGTAAAQEPTFKFGKKVPVTGESRNGRDFDGTFAIKRFTRSDGRAWAVGTLRGELGNRRVVRRGVTMPVTLAQAGATQQQPPPLPVPTPGACEILSLVLGPIDLNLLGLRVATNEIRLLIEAVPGALLGDLLCGIANLLSPAANTPLSQLVQLLNALLALSPRTAAPA